MDISSIVGQEQTAATRSEATLANDFDNFLVLLTTQLQYQDPLAPMDSNQFTQQLVSFTGVEQSIATNKNLEEIVKQNKSLEKTNAVGYLGKEIIVQTEKGGISEDGTVNWDYALDASTASTKLVIKDKNGFTIDTVNGALSAGTHSLSWTAPDDGSENEVYALTIEAKSSNDELVSHTIFSKGVVKGVEQFNGEIFLAYNGILTPPGNVLLVKDVIKETIPAEAGTY